MSKCSIWSQRETAPRTFVHAHPDVPEVILHLLYARGVKADVDIKRFLYPSLRQIPSPFKLFDTKRAANRILTAIEKKEKIFIYGDYDVDGVSAVAILWEYLYRELGADVTPYIPDRISEGYGLSESAIEKIIKQGANLIISVDCGIRDSEIVSKFKDRVDFIITDHHQPPESWGYTNDDIVVHPMFPGREFVFEKISGGAVSFLLKEAIRKLVEGKQYQLSSETEGLDLVGLSTVTDIMPLVDINRVFVVYALQQMMQNPRVGIENILELASIQGELDAYHLGFVIGPRLNAAGRLGSAMDALRLLLTNKQSIASALAKKLEDLNNKRRKMTEDFVHQALSQNVDEESKIIVVKGDNWHEGIIGLVAQKIQEHFYLPVIVVSQDGDEMKGSCRSIEGINITDLLTSVQQMFKKFGGHAMAAGFTLAKDFDEFRDAIIQNVEDFISDQSIFNKTVYYDVILSPADINLQLWNNFQSLKPYGAGNPRPTIRINNIKIVSVKYLGKEQQHLKLKAVGETSSIIDLLLFNYSGQKLSIGESFDVIGHLSLNIWNDIAQVEVVVDDIRISSSKTG